VCLAFGLLLFAATPPAFAHDPGLSSLDVRVGREQIDVVLTLAVADVDLLGGRDSLRALALESIEVRSDDRPLRGLVETVSLDGGNAVQVRLTYAGAMGSRLAVRSTVAARLARGHRELASIRAIDGSIVSERLLDANWAELDARVEEATNGAVGRFARFFTLGVVHILTGYDHLLFLAALLVVVSRWREVFQTITAFTVAHSITLALATTGVVHAPVRIVEALIAASIIYVGLENLVRSVSSSRWKLTFAFGLIHGLGFASALRDLGIGTSGAAVVLPLAAFNAGVEVGQTAVAAAFVLPFWKLSSPRRAPVEFASVWSLVVVIAGTYWLIERIL
jgi:hydrogenase/urease accessory protein HupE